VRVDEKANLNECHRYRGIAPGEQLAAIHGESCDALDAFGPLTRLLMIGKIAAKGKTGP